jgi:hypothetical protein
MFGLARGRFGLDRQSIGRLDTALRPPACGARHLGLIWQEEAGLAWVSRQPLPGDSLHVEDETQVWFGKLKQF